jgi:hypothetical protein
MKVYAIVTVATEIEGRLTFVKFEKAFLSAHKAEEHMKTLNKSWREIIQAHNQSVDCMCERSVNEIEVDESVA